MSAEKRREKFVELAESRVNKAIKQIRLIGNLSNRSNYSYTEGDSEKICNALQAEIRALRLRFDSSEKASEPSFSLK